MDQTKKRELIILYGCGDFNELKYRIDIALKLIKKINNIHKNYAFILFTGTESENNFFLSYIKPYNLNLFITSETNSKDTIDNVINSFNIIFNIKNGLKFNDFDNGFLNQYDAGPFEIIYNISSAYHLQRIKYILQVCNFYNENMEFYGSLEYNETRYVTEYNIIKNKEEYTNWIKQRIKNFK